MSSIHYIDFYVADMKLYQFFALRLKNDLYVYLFIIIIIKGNERWNCMNS